MPREVPKSKAGKREKMRKVMDEFKSGSLRSGSGGKVKSRAQAIAIGLKQSGQSRYGKRGKRTSRRTGR